MAIIESLASPIRNYEERWQDHTGLEVESFITSKLLKGEIVGISYENEKLVIERADHTTISGDVSVVTPAIVGDILIDKIRVTNKPNVKIFNNNPNNLNIFKIDPSTKVEAGICVYKATTRDNENFTNYPGFIEVIINSDSNIISTLVRSINYSDITFDKDKNIQSIDPENLIWVDITSLFTSSSNTTILATISYISETSTITRTSSFTGLLPQHLNLKYNSENYTVLESCSFNLGFTSSNYKLVGFNNGTYFEGNAGDTSIKLNPGLNKLILKALLNFPTSLEGKSIQIEDNLCSLWLLVDIINTSGVPLMTEALVAINNIASNVSNDAMSELFEVTIYNPNYSEVKLDTYLDSELDTFGIPIREEIFNIGQYDSDTKILSQVYKRYIRTSSGEKYLKLKINGEDYIFLDAWLNSAGVNLLESSITAKPVYINELDSSLLYTGVTDNLLFNFDQSTGQQNNVFRTRQYATADNQATVSNLETEDGWKEDNGLTIFRMTQTDNEICKINPTVLGALGGTIECKLKTYNVSNENVSLFTYGDLIVKSNQICWNLPLEPSNPEASIKDKEDTRIKYYSRVSYFESNYPIHIIITWNKINIPKENEPYYPAYLSEASKKNLSKATPLNAVKVYIDGCIVREFVLDDAEFRTLNNSIEKTELVFSPKGCDVDFSLFRLYGRALNDSEVILNYLASLDTVSEKKAVQAANDIISPITNEISFKKCYNKYNTILYVLPKGCRVPTRDWGGMDADKVTEGHIAADKKKFSKSPVTVFINYANKNLYLENDAKECSGRITNTQMTGLGSSAMRYLIWNVQSQLGKFTERPSKFTPTTANNLTVKDGKEIFIESPKNELNNKYLMPRYTDLEYAFRPEIKKLCGKVNFASSMLSHKLGAVKLYNDAYLFVMSSLHKPGIDDLEAMKACTEEPFLYFYWESDFTCDKETDEFDISKVELGDILSDVNLSNIKFFGFQTWGSAKADKKTFGISDKYPDHLILEGGENTDTAVNFRCPWHALQRHDNTTNRLAAFPTCSKEDSIKDSSKNLHIADESIVYANRGAWDVDTGLVDSNDAFTDGAKKSLNKFREFFDFVYKYDFTFLWVTPSTSADSLDKFKKVVFSNKGSFNYIDADKNPHTMDVQKFEIIRYEEYSGKWVKGGLYYNGTDWESLLLTEIVTPLNQSTDSPFRDAMQEMFKQRIGDYVNLDDIDFHLAFVRFVSGTDNRAKNTYFLIRGPKYTEDNPDDKEDSYKVNLVVDDLDTIFLTDNSGLLSKSYNLMEPSYCLETSREWGDSNNVFFFMYDRIRDFEIILKLSSIISYAFENSKMRSISTNMYKKFFSILEYFPAIAYDHTSKIYYENGQFIKNNNLLDIGADYTNNGVEPIQQVHGNALSEERWFMDKRLKFLGSQAKAITGETSALVPSGSLGRQINVKGMATAYLDFYPTATAEGTKIYAVSKNASSNTESAFISNKNILKTSDLNTIISVEHPSAINASLDFIDCYKTLQIEGVPNNSWYGNYDHLLSLKVLNDYNIFGFPKEYPKASINSFNINAPVLEELILNNIELPNSLDLSKMHKLKTIDLSGTTKLTSIIFPNTSKLKEATLPDSIETLNLYNNPNLTNLDIILIVDNTLLYRTENLKNVTIDFNTVGLKTINNEDVIEVLAKANLKTLVLTGLNHEISEETLGALISIPECILRGKLILKSLSLNTKLQLISHENFGDIDSKDNSIYIEYPKVPITEMSCDSNLRLYGQLLYLPAYNISVNPEGGNNIRIKKYKDKYVPDITYQFPATTAWRNLVLASDSTTGEITVKKASDSTEQFSVTIIMRLNPINGSTDHVLAISLDLKFAWTPPNTGDFAYLDGTFSPSYSTTKTLIGLVYNVVEDDPTSGTAYIIGKEFLQATPVTFSKLTTLPSGKTENDIDLEALATYNISRKLNDDIPKSLATDGTWKTVGEGDVITANSSVNSDKSYMNGKLYTQSYIDLANYFLARQQIYDRLDFTDIYKNITAAYKSENWGMNREDAIKLAKTLIHSLWNPYFYLIYLYEPKTKASETLNNQYTKNNWYVPSIDLATIVLIERGKSAIRTQTGNDFDTIILSNLVASACNETYGLGIFSKAKKAMGATNFPECWENIVNNNYLVVCESLLGAPYCYGYYGQGYSSSNNMWYNAYAWKSVNTEIYIKKPQPLSNIYNYTFNLWPLIPKAGIPFTEFNYKK